MIQRGIKVAVAGGKYAPTIPDGFRCLDAKPGDFMTIEKDGIKYLMGDGVLYRLLSVEGHKWNADIEHPIPWPA